MSEPLLSRQSFDEREHSFRPLLARLVPRIKEVNIRHAQSFERQDINHPEGPTVRLVETPPAVLVIPERMSRVPVDLAAVNPAVGTNVRLTLRGNLKHEDFVSAIKSPLLAPVYKIFQRDGISRPVGRRNLPNRTTCATSVENHIFSFPPFGD